MFKEIMLRESEETNETEFLGQPEAGSVIKFNRLVDWMNSVKASNNAKYLKCITNKALKVVVYNITDIKFSADVIHKTTKYDAGIKIAFKEDDGAPAMTIAKAAELFGKIEQLCVENGKDINQIEVFTEDVNGKLSRFCWYYDDATDTALIVRNMPPAQARRFMHGGGDVIVRKLVETPVNPDKLIDQLAAIEEKMAALASKRDEVLTKMDAMPNQATA